MLYKLLNFLKMCLPYIVVVNLYRFRQDIPVNFRSKSGNSFSAVMINSDYGILYSRSLYVSNRAKFLKEKQKKLNEETDKLLKEINALSFETREAWFGNEE